MDSRHRVGEAASFGLLGYMFVGMTAAVMMLAVVVVLIDVTTRAPQEGPPASISAARR